MTTQVNKAAATFSETMEKINRMADELATQMAMEGEEMLKQLEGGKERVKELGKARANFQAALGMSSNNPPTEPEKPSKKGFLG